MKEIWRTITGFNNYQVSNMGRVMSIGRYVLRSNCPGGIPIKHWHRGRILSPRELPTGYLRVSLSNETVKSRDFPIHRLVAKEFVSGFFDGATVNHIDFDKRNNKAENLEWVSHAENMRHLADSGRLREALEKMKRERRGRWAE